MYHFDRAVILDPAIGGLMDVLTVIPAQPPRRNTPVVNGRWRAVRLFVLASALAGVAISVPVDAQAPAFAASTSSGASGNVVVNGSFERPVVCPGQFNEYDRSSTAITGWVVGGNSVDLVCHTYFAAAAGRQSIDLAGSTSGSVSQGVATTPGDRYTLTWHMAGNTNCGQTVKTMHVLWNGKLVDAPSFNMTGRNNAQMGWVKRSLSVTAVSATSTIEFADATPDHCECGATLDNVSLTRQVS
jgi:choice-of-anchor C domain-containing protein